MWRTHRDELPSFSGFLVHDYRSYSVLEADPGAYLDFTQQRNDTLKGEFFLFYHPIIKSTKIISAIKLERSVGIKRPNCSEVGNNLLGNNGGLGARSGFGENYGSKSGLGGNFGSKSGLGGNYGSRSGLGGNYGSKSGLGGGGNYGSKSGLGGGLGGRSKSGLGGLYGSNSGFGSKSGLGRNAGSKSGIGGLFGSGLGAGYGSKSGIGNGLNPCDPGSSLLG